MPDALHHLAEGVGERERDRQEQEDREPVGQRRRVLERRRRVLVEEPAAVVAELLDRLHEADRTSGDRLGHAVQARRGC